MLISPEWYYEENLKGQTPEQIMSKIRGLKREINRLQKEIDRPEYPYRTEVIDPSEDVQLSMCREYLDKAKLALVEAGGVYIPTKAEQRAAAIEASMPYISKIVFTKGGLFTGHYAKTFVFGDNTLHMSESFSYAEVPVILDISDHREELIEELMSLHLERWRRHYDLYRYGMAVMDGESWELKLFFSNGHRPLRITGDNAYPFDFYHLEDVLGLPVEQEN